MYKRMLVPLDGLELAEKVTPYAKELAGRLDPDTVLKTTLHVLEVEKRLGRKPLSREATKQRVSGRASVT